MERMFFKFVLFSFAILTSITAFAESPKPIIREERKIIIDGVEERWRLEWVNTTSPACAPPDNPDWMICPCNGFAFGERGDLVLVRKKPGQKEEHLRLGPLFSEAPADIGEAVLQRWDVQARDYDERDIPGFVSRLQARPIVQIMRFGDYDHDGRATEFVLQIGTLPCGKKMSVVIGVSRHNKRLHAFSSVRHPETPLVLQAWHWESLLNAKGPIKVIYWPCGDHASEKEEELELRAEKGRIHVTLREYECKEKGRGKLIKEEAL